MDINYDSLDYFYRHKTLERMSGWPEQLELIKKRHPVVAKAYNDLQEAKLAFEVLFENMLEASIPE